MLAYTTLFVRSLILTTAFVKTTQPRPQRNASETRSFVVVEVSRHHLFEPLKSSDAAAHASLHFWTAHTSSIAFLHLRAEYQLTPKLRSGCQNWWFKSTMRGKKGCVSILQKMVSWACLNIYLTWAQPWLSGWGTPRPNWKPLDRILNPHLPLRSSALRWLNCALVQTKRKAYIISAEWPC